MPRRFRGSRVYAARATRGVIRPSQWFGRKEVWYFLEVGQLLVQFVFRPFQGCIPINSARASGHEQRDVLTFPDVRSLRLKKISLGGADGGDEFPLNPDSTILKKLPRFLEFLTTKKYADGTPRKPGRFWFESDGVAFTLTLFEATAFARVRLRAASVDDAFMAAEKHLGAEDAPWENDEYARDREAKKKKGK